MTDTQFAVSSIIDDETTSDALPPVRWLRRLATSAVVFGLSIGGCVMGATGPTLKTCQAGLPAAELQPLARVQTSLAAPVRKSGHAPALAFDLATSSRQQVRDWAAERNLSCRLAAVGRLLQCDDHGADGPTHLTFRFDGRGQLTSVERVQPGMSLSTARARFAMATAELDRLVGEATAVVGAGRGFVTAAYQRSVRDYDYAGYRATVTATHFGRDGVQLRESYSLR